MKRVHLVAQYHTISRRCSQELIELPAAAAERHFLLAPELRFCHFPLMVASPQFYVKRDNSEEGPLTIAQLNRMKNRGIIVADTLCRRAEDPQFRRLDEVLPHMKDHAPMSSEEKAKLKQDLIENEVRIYTQTGFASGALFWAPFGIGFMTAAVAVYCGFVLLIKIQASYRPWRNTPRRFRVLDPRCQEDVNFSRPDPAHHSRLSIGREGKHCSAR